MNITKIDKHIQLIDLETAGIENLIASYILKGDKVTIIETGPASSVQNLLSSLEELAVKDEEVAYVAVSHIHLDHSGGAGALLKQLPKAKLIVHWRGAPHLVNPEKLWTESKKALGSISEKYGKPEPVSGERIIAARDGMVFDVGKNVKIKAIETLGHASHHLAFCDMLSGGVFTGDAAGIYLNTLDVVVPTTPSPFRLDIALASLEKLINLKPKVLYYSHFGKAHAAVERLAAYKNQLRLWAEIAKQGMEKGEKQSAISKGIFESDPALQKAAKYLKNHPILSKTVFNQSVEGVLKFVEKFAETQNQR